MELRHEVHHVSHLTLHLLRSEKGMLHWILLLLLELRVLILRDWLYNFGLLNILERLGRGYIHSLEGHALVLERHIGCTRCSTCHYMHLGCAPLLLVNSIISWELHCLSESSLILPWQLASEYIKTLRRVNFSSLITKLNTIL